MKSTERAWRADVNVACTNYYEVFHTGRLEPVRNQSTPTSVPSVATPGKTGHNRGRPLPDQLGKAESASGGCFGLARATAGTSTNFFIRFSVKKRMAKAEKSLERPHVQVLLEWAETWQALLDSGEVKGRVELARLFGVAAERVSNIMNLLKLAPEIQQAIRALPVGTPRRVMSEYGLRELARLTVGEQRRRWNVGCLRRQSRGYLSEGPVPRSSSLSSRWFVAVDGSNVVSSY